MSKEKDETVTTTLRLTKEKHLKLKQYCLDNGLTMTDFFNICIDKANIKKKDGK